MWFGPSWSPCALGLLKPPLFIILVQLLLTKEKLILSGLRMLEISLVALPQQAWGFVVSLPPVCYCLKEPQVNTASVNRNLRLSFRTMYRLSFSVSGRTVFLLRRACWCICMHLRWKQEALCLGRFVSTHHRSPSNTQQTQVL